MLGLERFLVIGMMTWKDKFVLKIGIWEWERRQERPTGRGWRFPERSGGNTTRSLDEATRKTLCSGAAALSGGGSCLLLGERRKLGGVQGALSRAALVAPAGAKLPLLQVCCLGTGTTLGGTTTPPRVVPCSDMIKKTWEASCYAALRCFFYQKKVYRNTMVYSHNLLE